MVPEYLCELVSIRKSSRKLRSSSQIQLQMPVSRLKSYGDCAFSVACVMSNQSLSRQAKAKSESPTAVEFGSRTPKSDHGSSENV